jgi:hypothetical protein
MFSFLKYLLSLVTFFPWGKMSDFRNITVPKTFVFMMAIS